MNEAFGADAVAALAEKSTETAKGRGPGRPFVKGQSGNPGGHPRGLVRAVREQTRDGEELVAFMLRVFRGEAENVRLRDQLEAATWLADHGFGKPIGDGAREQGRRGADPIGGDQAVVEAAGAGGRARR